MKHQRHTLQRQHVLRAVKGSGRFLTTEEVFQLVRKRTPSVGLATVYRNLSLLTDRGEIFSFEGSDSVRRYAGHVFYDATFTCEWCGQRSPVLMKKYEEQVARALPGRTIFFSRLDVRGLCRQCTAGRAVRKARS